MSLRLAITIVACCEAFLAKKLTSSLVVEVGKGMAKKWIKDKTTPKESLLAAFGAEDHGLVVRHPGPCMLLNFEV